MKLRLRPAVAADAAALGDICFRAFHTLATAHGFAPDFPNAEVAAGMMQRLADHKGFFSVVAEIDGKASEIPLLKLVAKLPTGLTT